MAQMIPDELPQHTSTQGERLVFRYLKQLLPDDFQVYVEPEIQTKRKRQTSQPDFVIFGPDFGLLVLEVKDWTLSQIAQADTYTVSVKFDKRKDAQTITNPLRKVRTYCYEVLDQLKKQKLLTQQGGPHKGQFCAPFGWAVVFSNINRNELEASPELARLFPKEYTLCRDELLEMYKKRDDRQTLNRFSAFLAEFPFDPITDIQTQAVEYVLSSRWSIEGVKNWITGSRTNIKGNRSDARPISTDTPDLPNQLSQRIQKVERPLTSDQVQTVRGVIHPESVVRISPATSKSVPEGWTLPKNAKVLEVLTAEQEQQARAIGPGNRIFFGVAGSGKTILLLARAKRLAANDPDAKILVLCYNNTLLSYLKKHLEHHTNIEVQTVITWANQRYGLRGETSEPEQWTQVLRMGIGHSQYDSILIDEGHDFNPNWFRGVMQALKGGEDGDLLIAIDGSQSLYNRPRNFTWKSLGVNAQGRSKKLARNYRNTREIFEFAWQITQPPIDHDSEDEINDTHVRVEPEVLERTGSKPQFLLTTRLGSQAEAIAAVINKWKTCGLQDRDIGIIACNPGQSRQHIHKAMEILKNRYGRQTRFAFTVSKANKRRVIQSEGVAVLSLLSAKGLEFPAVLILGLEEYKHSWGQGVKPSQFYVGMTRAIHELVLSANADCWLSQQIDTCPWIAERIQQYISIQV
jgi:Nuclease-related domain/UvrD-like helicase C-terminal domain